MSNCEKDLESMKAGDPFMCPNLNIRDPIFYSFQK